MPVVETPRTLAEALESLSASGARPVLLAGGCGVMIDPPDETERVVDLHRVDELRGVREEEGGAWLGALTTIEELVRSPLVARGWPLLVEAARVSGAVQILNRATIGGCLATRDSAAELPPVLLVHESEVEVTGTRGSRRVGVDAFVSAAGEGHLEADELITGVGLRAPVLPHDRLFFRKVAGRRAAAEAKVVVAACARLATGGVIEGIAIGLGGVGQHPIRAHHTEEVLMGHVLDHDRIAAAREALMEEIDPPDDMHSTARYRRFVTGNLITRWLGELAG